MKTLHYWLKWNIPSWKFIYYFVIFQPDNDGTVGQSSTADRAILIGTASKGIIDRQFQHHAQVYHQIYAPNPFSVETDADIKKYVDMVKAKNSQSAPVSARSGYSQYDEVEAGKVAETKKQQFLKSFLKTKTEIPLFKT